MQSALNAINAVDTTINERTLKMIDILFIGNRADNNEPVIGYLWQGSDHAYITPYKCGVDYADKTQKITATAYEVMPETVAIWRDEQESLQEKYNLFFGENTHIELPSKKSAIQKADDIGRALLNVCILGELNTMQSEASITGQENPVFTNKYTIPDYFINLVLSKYNMSISPVIS